MRIIIKDYDKNDKYNYDKNDKYIMRKYNNDNNKINYIKKIIKKKKIFIIIIKNIINI